MHASTPDPNLNATESSLRALAPTPPRFDRDRLMYEAGRRSRRRRGWPMAAGFFAALSALLAVRLASVPELGQPETIATTNVPAALAPPTEVLAGAKRNPTEAGLVELLLGGVPDSLPADHSRQRQIDEWLRGGPIDSPAVPADSRPLAWPDDSTDPTILRRGRL